MVRTRLLSLQRRQIELHARGITPVSENARISLESAGGAFVEGFNAALGRSTALDLLSHDLELISPDHRGFAYEGAAMALTILDRLVPWGDRLARFLAGPAQAYCYTAHVGAGWALRQLHLRPDRMISRLTPALRWLVMDGYAFHACFFAPESHLDGRPVPARIAGYGKRAFDQGLGRGLWFVAGADVDRIAMEVDRFEVRRRSDLYSGLGLAATYAGGVETDDLLRLQQHAGPMWIHLAQGAAFAAKARQVADNATSHTHKACRVLCGMSVSHAAELTDVTLRRARQADRPTDDTLYGQWRRRISGHFSDQEIVRRRTSA